LARYNNGVFYNQRNIYNLPGRNVQVNAAKTTNFNCSFSLFANSYLPTETPQCINKNNEGVQVQVTGRRTINFKSKPITISTKVRLSEKEQTFVDRNKEYESLEFKPNLEYILPDADGSYLGEYGIDSDAPREIREIFAIKTSDCWDVLSDMHKEIAKLESLIKSRTIGIKTIIKEEEALNVLSNIKKQYGDNSPLGEMSFELYKTLLNSPSYENVILCQAFEEEHKGPDGNESVELYPILLDIKNDANTHTRLFKNTVFNLLDDSFNGNISDGTINNNVLTYFGQTENRKELEVIEIQRKINGIQESIIKDSSNMALLMENQILLEKKRQLLDTEKTITDMKKIIISKAVEVTKIAGIAISSLEDKNEDLFNADIENIAFKIISSASPSEVKKQITTMKILAEEKCKKLSIEQTKNKNQMEHLNNSGMRQLTEIGITSNLHERQKLTIPTVNWLLKVGANDNVEDDNNPINDIADVIMEEITDKEEAYEKSNLAYDQQSRTSLALKKNCIISIKDKNKIRRFYQLIKIIDEIITAEENSKNGESISKTVKNIFEGKYL